MNDPAVSAALLGLGHPGHGPLALAGVPLAALAERFGTPFYAYAAPLLDARLRAVQQALGPRVEILYSVKANPLLALVARLRAGGAGAEVASLGELHLALAAGHAPTALRFAGPGKTPQELDAAVALGLGTVHVEAADEVAELAAAAARHGRRVGVAVRVNLPQELAGARLRMGGRSSRFGIDLDQVEPVLRAVAAAPALQLRGLHVYGGTQCFDAAAFTAHAAALVEQAAAWERRLGLPLDELDLGGGFGVPTYHGDPEFDLAAAGRGVQQLIAAHDRPGRRWFVELGRYLVAPCGVYVARVVRQKTSGGVRHVVLDGGLHHAAMACGQGAVLRRPPLLVAAASPAAAPAGEAVVGGPLCTPADQFGDGLPLPELAPGALLAVLHAGAYGASYSPTAFLSHPAPAELLVGDGPPRLCRERGRPEDVLRGQHP